jgi:hypothetical protein
MNSLWKERFEQAWQLVTQSERNFEEGRNNAVIEKLKKARKGGRKGGSHI